MKHTRYIVEWGLDETPEFLYRYRKTDDGYWAEYLDIDGKWVEDSKLFGLLTELHNKYYDDISEEKATEIARQLGGSINS